VTSFGPVTLSVESIDGLSKLTIRRESGSTRVRVEIAREEVDGLRRRIIEVVDGLDIDRRSLLDFAHSITDGLL
jgi:hypothetical protein